MVELTELFSNVSIAIYRDNSKTNPVFTSINQDIVFKGLDTNENYVGDGVYSYTLTLDNNEYTRLLGVYSEQFCLLDLECRSSCYAVSELPGFAPYDTDPTFAEDCH